MQPLQIIKINIDFVPDNMSSFNGALSFLVFLGVLSVQLSRKLHISLYSILSNCLSKRIHRSDSDGSESSYWLFTSIDPAEDCRSPAI